ncbi:hypothetical protein Snoj_01820 [Streptomyces nojiriensis]|uniref:Uncharacterized protein n=1 Tax=Streptomyces nojiriensis TaxID=66374 RepID=A0ABQ3SDR7_9ACTN|nr:hypothetical protein GCM10010205_50790 [Streptomyces nojiriensis]GHI66264.1 hypothetical protein Snoj_01820 [Streptomyces nojiriensis]
MTRLDLEGQLVDGGLGAEALGQADCLDHLAAPYQAGTTFARVRVKRITRFLRFRPGPDP